MPNKISKFNYNDKFRTKKGKVITIIGVFKDEKNVVRYYFDEIKGELSEEEISKLEKINPDDKTAKSNKARS